MSRASWERVEMAKVSLWVQVYKQIKQIPRGRVSTYGAVAKAIRLRGGARSVGRAMAVTPKGQGIPWHRVLGAGGKILIRGESAMLQRKLLESEGIEVLESRIKIAKYLWTPPRRKSTKKSATKKKTSAR